MKPAPSIRLGRLTRLDALSPLGFVLTAAFFALVYAGCELAGLRESTTFLSGTAVGGDWPATVRLGAIYLLAYFGLVMVVPILLLAAALLVLWQRLVRPSKIPPKLTSNHDLPP
jgi:hypothetical protein